MENVTDESAMSKKDVIDQEQIQNMNKVKINSSTEKNLEAFCYENKSITSSIHQTMSHLLAEKDDGSAESCCENRKDQEEIDKPNTTSNITDDEQTIFNVEKDGSTTETEISNKMSYNCGVCHEAFPDITRLHEHMINDEKVKGYKYNTEDKTASIVDAYQRRVSGKIIGKKRGKRRKKENPDEDWSDGRYIEYIPIKVEVDGQNEIIEQSLVKFERTIETKKSNSAFFDPVSHGYGTRRSSFLKMKEHTFPRNGIGKKVKKRKISDENEIVQDDLTAVEDNREVVDTKTNFAAEDRDIHENKISLATEDREMHVNEANVAVEEDQEIDETKINIAEKETGVRGVDLKPDGTLDIDSGEIESDEVNSAEDDSEYEPSDPESDHDEPSDPESDPSWVDHDEKRSTEKSTSKASHTDKSTFQKSLKPRQSIKNKKKDKSVKTKLYKCKTCGRVLRSKTNANKHRTLHLLKEESAEFEETEMIEIKKENVEQEDIYNQQKVLEKTAKNKNVDNTSHDEQEGIVDRTSIFSCLKCDETFTDKKDLKEHELTTHRRKVHKCDICQKIFSKLYRLEDHKDTFHSEEKFECEICNAKLPNRRKLWSHKGCHLSPTDKYFSEEVASKIREEYRARNQSKTRPEIVECTICGKNVVSKRLIRHMHTHNTSKDFECEICHKRFTNKRYVRDHIRKSHGNITSTCDICGHTFKGTSYLEKHKQTHGPKDKICKVCGRGFTTEFYLRIHMVTHTEEKQFKCKFCKAAFKHKARLDIHVVERHTKGQDRPCKYCGQLFPSRHKARLHERKVHEGYTPTSVKPRRHAEMMPKVVKVQNFKGAKYNEASQYPNQVTLKIDEDAESVEQIIEIPENSQQCQLMILPNGVIKVLNVIEEGSGPTVIEANADKKDNNITVQYLSEDGNEVIENGDAHIQYIEVDESEFNLLTQTKDPSTHIVEIVDPSGLN